LRKKKKNGFGGFREETGKEANRERRRKNPLSDRQTKSQISRLMDQSSEMRFSLVAFSD